MVGLRKTIKKLPKVKDVRLKFCKLDNRQKEAVARFIENNLSKKDGAADHKFDPDSPEEKRSGVRVLLSSFVVNVHTHASSTLESQEFEGQLTDLSEGGCCIRVAQDVKLTKNSKAIISLEFILDGLKAEVEILGLQYDD